MRPRVIPLLLVENGGLVKTVRFRARTYLGDPINTARLFNDMEVDELIVLDIEATRIGQAPNFDLIRALTGECFMPVCYGGGIRSLEHVRKLFELGVEKVAINTGARRDPRLIRELAEVFGSQSIVVSVDVRKTLFGKYEIYDHPSGKTAGDPVAHIQEVAQLGAGEVLLNFVDRDGIMHGYDIEFITRASSVVNVPVVVCGGAGTLADCVQAVNAGAHAAAAGSLFVFQGKERGVLINYPSQDELERVFGPVIDEKLK